MAANVDVYDVTLTVPEQPRVAAFDAWLEIPLPATVTPSIYRAVGGLWRPVAEYQASGGVWVIPEVPA